MTTLNLDYKNDDLIELNKDSFNKSPFSFNIPAKQNRANSSSFANDDVLFNKNKISSDVISMSSRSSVSSSSSDDYKKKYMKKISNKKKYSSSEASDTSSEASAVPMKKKHSGASDASSEYSSSAGSDASGESSGSGESGESEESGSGNSGEYSSESSAVVKKKVDPQKRFINEVNEKREIIYQLDRLESKGYKVPFKFNMNSNIEEMRMEFDRIVREKELDASVRFQQKMMMAFVSGAEYMNTRYDPFSIKLDGWSEQVNENINDFDDIFEEMHYKYKSSGKKMAPELRLLISLSGSAFMFHLTSRMFKEQPLPNVEEVLKSDPELMKHFQNAAAKQFIMGNNGLPNKQMPSLQNMSNVPQQGQSQGMGLFNMVSNLFGSLTPSMPPPMPQQYKQKSSVDDIDNIIKNVHSNISIDNNDNNIETLSVSDEEITSIIEDTADIKILRNKGRANPNKRTLNI